MQLTRKAVEGIALFILFVVSPHCNDILEQLSAIWSWVVVWPGNGEHVKTGELLLRYTYLQVFSAKQNRTHGVLSEFLFPPDPPHAGIYFNLFHFYPNSSLEGGAKIPDECFVARKHQDTNLRSLGYWDRLIGNCHGDYVGKI